MSILVSCVHKHSFFIIPRCLNYGEALPSFLYARRGFSALSDEFFKVSEGGIEAHQRERLERRRRNGGKRETAYSEGVLKRYRKVALKADDIST